MCVTCTFVSVSIHSQCLLLISVCLEHDKEFFSKKNRFIHIVTASTRVLKIQFLVRKNIKK